MSELITEYFTCKKCHQNYSISIDEMKDIPTMCNDCWLKMNIWEKYEDSDLKNVC
ncbi:hypothetical protein [Nitrosopumilus cobalaminigenes]|uniref:hypothetical protein n=1 Tax=Nitrosopumilus cobalaminigenes TaxID=1470066 RepID=UPI0015CBD87F|nr:hypothetical protein [Nitrosopumilus cobalaminigenes]